MRTQHLKLMGAAGAAALTVGALAGPAVAAPQAVNYTCTVGAASTSIPITMDLGTLPASMVAGQSISQTISSGSVHLGPDAVGLAELQGWDQFSATATGAGASPYSLKVPKTAVPAAPAPIDIPATGSFTLHPKKAGTYRVKAGTTAAKIQGFIGGAKANVIPLSCAAPTDGSNNFGNITVAKDKSKTTTKASYSAAKDVATGTAKVSGATFKLPGTGKVTFTLKKGAKTIKSVKATLKKGSAKASFKNVKAKGKYSITATFKGDAGLKGSSGKAPFTVK